MTMAASLDAVDDDLLTQILLYSDVTSAVRFSECTSRSWRQRILSSEKNYQHVWKNLYERQLFSKEDLPQEEENYIQEIKRRRQLFQNLIQSKRTSCFSLPHRFFHFWPLLPSDDDFNRDDDPPPVHLECDSFLLTSTGTSTEFLLLDPFTSTLAVYSSVLDNTSHHFIPPQQVLLTTEDYFVDLAEYFQPNNHEYELSYLGIEAKPILNNNTTMLAVGRMLAPDDTWNDEHRVIELLAWFQKQNDNIYADRHVCRFRGAFQSVDISAAHKRLYCNRLDIDNDNFGRTTIEVYRLEPYPENEEMNSPDSPTHFPEPEFVMDCHQQVTTLSVCATGTHVVVATAQGHVQIWRVDSTTTTMLQQQTIPIQQHLKQVFQGQNYHPHPDPVNAIFTPRHLDMQLAGFVTCQDSRTHGTCLMFWKFHNEEWSIESIIKVPLSSRRAPQVHFDGRRLIVLGQDHIGVIILVYEILTPDSSKTTEEKLVECSGGVYHLNSRPAIRFANRIRHAALGGFEYYDSLYMTCNERFIVVNTKTGNLLNDTMATTSCTDGLVVIDLEEP